ncbi:Leader peptidase PppA [Planctomycetes bacterium Pan216]|uniref:Leader peptidase PppA n=1 Tax=Kolteria novifilia TaxID=2527975 RepID=A0A518BAA1_9BACT|nr:Leader peptidase PppA [Planctomycetes bacterium Pan216]
MNFRSVLRFIVQSILLATFVWLIIVRPAMVYLNHDDKPSSRIFKIDEATAEEEVAETIAEGMTLLWFFFLGASVGSFINVVAYRWPRGISISMGKSSCPHCEQRIAWYDNVPVLSWLQLKGACRKCDKTIPARYIVVELVMGSIFLSFFFLELIGGGAIGHSRFEFTYVSLFNVLLIDKRIILYIFLFHGLLMAFLMTMVLIRVEGKAISPRLVILGMVFGFWALLYFPDLQPYSVEGLSARRWGVGWGADKARPILVNAYEACYGMVVGGLMGLLLAQSKGAGGKESALRTGAIAMLSSVGLALGWQAAIAVSVASSLLLLVARLVGFIWHAINRIPLAIYLFVMTYAQIAAWRWLTKIWWWPGPESPHIVFTLGVGVVALVALLFRIIDWASTFRLPKQPITKPRASLRSSSPK